jgi:hypothetical protein
MTKLILMTDVNIIEGFSGLISMIIITNIINRIIDTHWFIVGGMSFFFVWGIRKISVNIYKYSKKKYGYHINNISIDI